MIQAKDLRVGNWVQPKTNHQGRFKGYRQVTTVYKEDAVVENHYPLSWFEPIPLTSEILERCGFVKHMHDKNYDFFGHRLGNLILYRVRENARSEVWFYEAEYSTLSFDERTNVCAKLLYLHQLQNLYHALTGEELESGIAINAKM